MSVAALRSLSVSLWRRHSRVLIAIVLVWVVAVVAIAVGLRIRGGGEPAGPTAVSVAPDRCGQGWSAPRPGAQVLQLRNPSATVVGAALIDGGGAIHGEVEGMAPNTSRPLAVTLGNGEYAIRCIPEDAPAVVGPRVRISGAKGPGGPAVVPVTKADLLAPLRTYQAFVGTGLGEVAARVATLREAVAAGDLDAARRAWLPAHVAYLRLGAAYGAFGDAGDAIDGLAAGQADGVADPGFTGFHRLEYGLWHRQDAATLTPVADRLAADVAQVQAAWPSAQIDPLDLTLRAHEIMEDALRFPLTGADDYGSGTGLATVDAQLQATAEVLSVLRPLLTPRYLGLVALDSWMTRTGTLVASYRSPDGGWPALAALTPEQRRKLNGDVGELAERLAPVATICEPRRTS
jgi:iron uptake system component EfeO